LCERPDALQGIWTGPRACALQRLPDWGGEAIVRRRAGLRTRDASWAPPASRSGAEARIFGTLVRWGKHLVERSPPFLFCPCMTGDLRERTARETLTVKPGPARRGCYGFCGPGWPGFCWGWLVAGLAVLGEFDGAGLAGFSVCPGWFVGAVGLGVGGGSGI